MFLANFDDDELVERRAPAFQTRTNGVDRLIKLKFQQTTRLDFTAYRNLFMMIEPHFTPKNRRLIMPSTLIHVFE